jgi:hypothetical protein
MSHLLDCPNFIGEGRVEKMMEGRMEGILETPLIADTGSAFPLSS